MVSGETFALKAQLTDLLAMCGTSSGSIVPAFMALAYRIVWAKIKSATRVKSLSDKFEIGKSGNSPRAAFLGCSDCSARSLWRWC